MAHLVATFTVVLSVYVIHVQSGSTVIPPPHSGTDIGLAVVAGRYLSFQQYITLGEQIQNAALDLSVWLYLSDDDFTSGHVISSSRDALLEAGMPSDAPLFVAGQDEAGEAMFREVASLGEEVSGLLLWGSDVEDPIASLRCPLLHVVGDLDGQIRMLAMANKWRELRDLVEVDEDSKYTYPMVTVLGMNHVQYVTGSIPAPLQQFVIVPELTDEEARETVTEATLTFIQYTLGQDDLQPELDRWYEETKQIMEPLVTVLLLEESDKESPWALTSQDILASLTSDEQDKTTIVNTVFPSEELPSQRGNVTVEEDGTVTVFTVTAVARDDTVPKPWRYQGTDMLESKMKSQEGIRHYLYPSSKSLHHQPTSCATTNMAAWSTAESALSVLALERYQRTNLTITFLEDIAANTGLGFFTANMTFSYSGSSVEVQSTNLVTALALGPELGGVHYCKHLSPAKALDFMLTDALRDPLSPP